MTSHPDSACPDCDGCGYRCDACGEPWPDGAHTCGECGGGEGCPCGTCCGLGVLDDDSDDGGES